MRASEIKSMIWNCQVVRGRLDRDRDESRTDTFPELISLTNLRAQAFQSDFIAIWIIKGITALRKHRSPPGMGFDGGTDNSSVLQCYDYRCFNQIEGKDPRGLRGEYIPK